VRIIKDRLMSAAELQSCLLPTVVRNINKEKSEEVRSCDARFIAHCVLFSAIAPSHNRPRACLQETEAWVSALCELIPMLDKETLKSQVMSMALSKGDMEDNASSRVICARILGACAPFLVSGGMWQVFMTVLPSLPPHLRLGDLVCGQACLGKHGMSTHLACLLNSPLA